MNKYQLVVHNCKNISYHSFLIKNTYMYEFLVNICAKLLTIAARCHRRAMYDLREEEIRRFLLRVPLSRGAGQPNGFRNSCQVGGSC